ncbi:hypothetical protein A6X21_13930 [Planctopirus hydrillae]|uniref:Uncharacterized protein n=1 Tax=Planctopirus hydrillae TaxID=1841610 RepID=A0A1C3E483_9PLAN|nr:hypothetical protein A6X21_13930 [Planctopirus hydrillae]
MIDRISFKPHEKTARKASRHRAVFFHEQASQSIPYRKKHPQLQRPIMSVMLLFDPEIQLEIVVLNLPLGLNQSSGS